MKTFVTFSTVLFSVAAFASGAAPHEIPGDVKFQAMNLAVFFGILLYFGAPKIKALFKQRNEDFHRVARETAKAKKELDDKKADVLRLTKQLRETSAQSLAQAKLEAEKVMNEQVAKANEEATRLSSDAQSQLKSDYSKLMEKLRQEALELSLVAAENKLQTLAAPEKAKVNSSFAARVEGATV